MLWCPSSFKHIYIGGLGLGFEYKFMCVLQSVWGFVIKGEAKMVNFHKIHHLATNPDLKTLTLKSLLLQIRN
jgi:hypothetical protein